MSEPEPLPYHVARRYDGLVDARSTRRYPAARIWRARRLATEEDR